LEEELPSAVLPDEKERFECQIHATDRQIDALVYDLYGLTEEEIKIVEGSETTPPYPPHFEDQKWRGSCLRQLKVKFREGILGISVNTLIAPVSRPSARVGAFRM
jgi:hypothetical protein